MKDAELEELLQREKKYEADLEEAKRRGASAQAGIAQADLDAVRAKIRNLRKKRKHSGE
jgi:hypothetical protein